MQKSFFILDSYISYVEKIIQAIFVLVLLVNITIHIMFDEFLWFSFVAITVIIVAFYTYILSTFKKKMKLCVLKKNQGVFYFQGIFKRFSFIDKDILQFLYSTNSTGNVTHVKLMTKYGDINLEMFLNPSSAIAQFESFASINKKPIEHVFSFGLFLHIFLWLSSGFLLTIILNNLFWAGQLNYLMYPILAMGVIFLEHRPINMLLAISNTIDLAVGILSIIVFVFYFVITIVVPLVGSDDDLFVPCAQLSPQMMCYKISEELCKSVWKGLEERCRYELADEINRRGPTALVGPMIKKCENQKFDKSLYYNRKNTDSEACQAFFEKIKK